MAIDFVNIVEFTSGPGGMRRPIRRNDFKRLEWEDEHDRGVAYIQQGRLISEDGRPIETISPGLHACLEKADPASLAALQFAWPPPTTRQRKISDQE